jgi:hypothetical protein
MAAPAARSVLPDAAAAADKQFRPQYEVESQDPIQPRNRPATAFARDGAIVERDPSGGRIAFQPVAQALSAPSGGSLLKPQETFAALDRVSAAAPALLHAGTQRAEAGFHDPALGWIGVRADNAGGAVHATLLPVSADASTALGSHLPDLSAYLAEHHAHVESVTLAAPESHAGAGMDEGAGPGSQNTGGESGQRGESERFRGPEPGAVADESSPGLTRESFSGGMEASAASRARSGGAHISVMA